MIAVGLFIGVFIVGPLVLWVLGMFNPLGYMGVPPWQLPEEAKRVCEKHGRRDCFCVKHFGGDYR